MAEATPARNQPMNEAHGVDGRSPAAAGAASSSSMLCSSPRRLACSSATRPHAPAAIFFAC